MIFRLLLLFVPLLPVSLTVADPVMMPWTIPQGTHYFNKPLVIEDMDGVVWRGYGSSRVTRLVYNGPPTKAFIQIIGSGRCRLENFEVAIAVPGVDAAVLICNAPTPNPNGRISNSNVIENVRVVHGPAGGAVSAKYAFSVDSTAMSTNYSNNEQHRFVRCYAQHYSVAGFHLNGTQAHQIVFDGCVAHDAGTRLPGATRYGLLAGDGSYFHWTNGTMTGNTTDFKTGTSEFMSVIDFHSSESSVQFLSSGRVGAESFTSISNVRWDGTPTPGIPVIDAFGPGPWSVRDSWFSGINGVCPVLKFTSFATVPGTLDLSGVLIRQHAGAQPVAPIVTAPQTWESRLHGVRHQYLDGTTGARTTKPVQVNKVPGVQ